MAAHLRSSMGIGDDVSAQYCKTYNYILAISVYLDYEDTRTFRLGSPKRSLGLC